MKPRFWGITLTIITCLSLFFTGPLLATIDKDNHADAIEFGVAPTADPDEMVKIWGPVVRYLSLKTGIKMRLKIAPSIETFEKQLGEGSVDMVSINP